MSFGFFFFFSPPLPTVGVPKPGCSCVVFDHSGIRNAQCKHRKRRRRRRMKGGGSRLPVSSRTCTKAEVVREPERERVKKKKKERRNAFFGEAMMCSAALLLREDCGSFWSPLILLLLFLFLSHCFVFYRSKRRVISLAAIF